MKPAVCCSGFILQRSRPALAIIISVALLVLISCAEYFLPSQLSLSIFYTIPVLLMTWYFGQSLAAISIIITSAIWLGFDVVASSRGTSLSLVWNFVVNVLVLILGAWLVLRLRKMIQQSHETARRDSVTGLPNSRTFYEVAELEVMRAKRYGHPVTIAFIDIDDFKLVNDQFGHPVGDCLLAEFSRLAFAILRRTDTIARIGGDEFVILMPETNQDESKFPIEKLRISMDTVMKEHNWPVTLSIGVYTFLTMPNNLQVMITFADSLMYKVKQAGKNQVAYEIFADEKATEIEDNA